MESALSTQAVLGSQKNAAEGTEISHIPQCSHASTASSTFKIPEENGAFVTTDC